jgi:hypothetical protein
MLVFLPTVFYIVIAFKIWITFYYTCFSYQQLYSKSCYYIQMIEINMYCTYYWFSPSSSIRRFIIRRFVVFAFFIFRFVIFVVS